MTYLIVYLAGLVSGVLLWSLLMAVAAASVPDTADYDEDAYEFATGGGRPEDNRHALRNPPL